MSVMKELSGTHGAVLQSSGVPIEERASWPRAGAVILGVSLALWGMVLAIVLVSAG